MIDSRIDKSVIEEMNSEYILVIKRPNSVGYRQINPDFIELKCAFDEVKEKMVDEMQKVSQMRPQRSTKMSKKEIKAWEAYQKIMGENMPAYFEYASLYEIASAGEKVILDYINKKEQVINAESQKTVYPIDTIDIG